MKKLLVVNAGIAALLGSGMAEAGFSPYYVGAGIGTASNNGYRKPILPRVCGLAIQNAQR